MTEKEYNELAARMLRAEKAAQRAKVKALELVAEYLREALRRTEGETRPTPERVQWARERVIRAELELMEARDELRHM